MYLKESILSKVATSSAALKMDYFKQAFFEEFFANYGAIAAQDIISQYSLF